LGGVTPLFDCGFAFDVYLRYELYMVEDCCCVDPCVSWLCFVFYYVDYEFRIYG
jgi:hypothetical protein